MAAADAPLPAVPTDTLATTKDLQVLKSDLIAEIHKEVAKLHKELVELVKMMMRVALMMVAAFAGALVTVALVV